MTSLYIHIPFCKKKCNYCDFVSYAGKEGLIDEYVAALCREIKGIETRGSRLKTIYFGGGTPSLLEPSHFDQIINNLNSSFVIRNSELTIEANPGTADKAKLKALRGLGINRLSIGAQSFNDKHLKTLGRIHTGREAIRFYDDARSAGFENINLDLIFALPNQTLDEWKSDLNTALNLTTEPPNHLSTYNLQIEEGTLLHKIINNQDTITKQYPIIKFQLPNEDEELAMYEYTIETLINAGYKHYEISNFAKPGFECLHNINYWKNGNYIGIGAGAHSHVNGKRWSNPNCLAAYMKNALRVTPDDSHFATAQRDTLFLGLRLLEGLSTEKFLGFEKEVAELIEDGLLEQNNGHYRLTRRGLYLGNLVFEKFI
jgi:oxygen-independent coproporphyrinogen-3 oxidase